MAHSALGTCNRQTDPTNSPVQFIFIADYRIPLYYLAHLIHNISNIHLVVVQRPPLNEWPNNCVSLAWLVANSPTNHEFKSNLRFSCSVYIYAEEEVTELSNPAQTLSVQPHSQCSNLYLHNSCFYLSILGCVCCSPLISIHLSILMSS